MTFPQITVAGDSVEAGLDVRMLVEVLEEFGPRSPARIEIRLRNESPEARRFYFGCVAPFNAMANERPATRILCLIPREDRGDLYSELIPSAPDGDCWRLRDEFLVPLSETVVTLPPGGEVSNTYAVLNLPNTTDCLPHGTYRFESDWGVYDPGVDAERRYSWGFRLELSD